MEIWKDVKGYEGEYLVSNMGRVKSIKKKFGTLHQETILKPATIWTGYLRVGLVKDKKSKSIFVHRLVAQEFIPNPENKPIINHINGDRTDNRVENLEWCTQKENCNRSDKVKNGERYNSVKVIDSEGNIFNSYRSAAKHYNINPNTVKNDCIGKTKYSPTQKGTDYERKIRFRRYYES